MNEIAKSIRMGTVDFFGVLVPGILVITMVALGVFMPLLSLLMDISNINIKLEAIDLNAATLILASLIIFAYVLGYILRLSSPDALDRISAKKVIVKEIKAGTDMVADGWPYDPDNPKDKYPYFNFRNYLLKRGHEHLTKALVTWGSDADWSAGKTWSDKGSDKKPIVITKRSKSTVNKMKMDVRLHCPELNGMLESKEGHIRLMAGAWAAFRFSMPSVIITFMVLGIVAVAVQLLDLFPKSQITNQNYFIYFFINFNLLMIMYYSNKQIEKLFHYRRVSELFHIVQAAYFAQEAYKKNASSK